MEDVRVLEVNVLEYGNSLFIPYRTKEGNEQRIGGSYWRDNCDPTIKTLQDQLALPCHNCQCYKAELKSLRAQLGIE